MLSYTIISAPFGSVQLAAGPRGLTGVTLSSLKPSALAARFRREHPEAGTAWPMPELIEQLAAYLEGRPVRFTAKVDLAGMTEFQREVLAACSRIPFGRTVSYGELARRIGRPRACRAVGAALGSNPVPLVIPCHRVVGSNGALTGFSAEQGVSLKRWLLELESPAVMV